jgi:hypothetical protein
MYDLFKNLTHYDDSYQRFTIETSNISLVVPIGSTVSPTIAYFKQENNILNITPTKKGKEYYITIKSFIFNYESQTLERTFRVLELPTINLKTLSPLKNTISPMYFSNIYNVYDLPYPFYQTLKIDKKESKLNKYVNNLLYVKNIINYDITNNIVNTKNSNTAYTYVNDTRGIAYNVNYDIYDEQYKPETINSNFSINIEELDPIVYKNTSNINIKTFS